jgi:hypothetical protein
MHFSLVLTVFMFFFCFKNKALLVMLSMCQFERVLELLGSQKLHAQAGLLLQACQEFEIISPASRSTDILLNSNRRHFLSQEIYCN